jgi:hypothetical protein
MEKPTNLFFSASVEEKHTKQTHNLWLKKIKEDGGAFIHMNSDAYSIYFLFIPISNLMSSIYT